MYLYRTSIFSCMYLWMQEGKVIQCETNMFHWFLDTGVSLCLLAVYLAMFIPLYVCLSTKWIFIRRCLWFIALCVCVCVSVLLSPGGSNEQEFSHAILIRCDVCWWSRLCVWSPLLVGWRVPMLWVLYSGSGILNNYPVEEALCLRW